MIAGLRRAALVLGVLLLAEAGGAERMEFQIDPERSEVRMPEGPIQELGEFTIGVHLHPDVDVDIVVRVVESE